MSDEDSDIYEADHSNRFNLRNEIVRSIQRDLDNSQNCLSCEEIVSLARNMGSNPYFPIQIDEDNVADFTDGNRSATIVLNKFKSKDIKECKKEFLTQQHTELWVQWSKLEKECAEQTVIMHLE